MRTPLNRSTKQLSPTVFALILGLILGACGTSTLDPGHAIDSDTDESTQGQHDDALGYPAGAKKVSTTITAEASPPTLAAGEPTNVRAGDAGDEGDAGHAPSPTLIAPSTTASTETSVVSTSTTSLEATEAELGEGEVSSLNQLNALRLEHGLAELSRDPDMDAFARQWSQQMAESGEFVHSSGPYGENIAFTSDVRLTAQQASELFHQLWLDSPDHLANMTNANYTNTGIGIFRSENGWYGTQTFRF